MRSPSRWEGTRCAFDVADRGTLVESLERCEAALGPIELLVANHAYMTMAPFLEMNDSDMARTFEVNLLGTAWLIQFCAPKMAQRGYGRIVAIASEWGVTGWPRACAYAASKGAVIALVKSAAREFASEGVAVNAVAPGVTDTAQIDVDAVDAGLSHDEMVRRVRQTCPARPHRSQRRCRQDRSVPALGAGDRVRGPSRRSERWHHAYLMAASVSAARGHRPIRLLEVTGRRGAQERSVVAYQPGCPLLRGDGDSAPVLWSDIGKSLREGPMMAGEILGRILPLAVLELGRLHQDAGAVATSPLAVRDTRRRPAPSLRG